MSVIDSSSRLQSLDALRGFDMCWILGLSGVLTKVFSRVFSDTPAVLHRVTQFEHADWDGFRFYDLIFPLFLFLAGVSLALALPKRVLRDGKGATVRHLILRALMLCLLGILVSGGLRDGWDQVRWLGVLQRIGLASAAAGLLSLWLGTRALVVSTVTLLLGYYALLQWVPVPGAGAGQFAEGMNLTNYLDSVWLPGRKYDGDHDPEGLLSTLPAIATALLGLLAGRWIIGTAAPLRKVMGLLVVGCVLLLIGWAWHPFFPVIKKLWTSSFVLVAGGWSMLLLGSFYWLVDVHGWRWGLAPFIWVGANPMALYLASGFGFFRTVSERLVIKPVPPFDWLPSLMTFALMLLTAWWLHRRKIYLRV